jgi:threonine synthase
MCTCGGPLLQEYELTPMSALERDQLAALPFNVWRYRRWLPVADDDRIVTLGEGGTPLIPLRKLGPAIGLSNASIKDEGRNPTGTFKARGASVAVSRLGELGYRKLAMPTVGSGGSAWSAYASRAGIQILVGLPDQQDLPVLGALESAAYGAEVVHVEGRLAEAFPRFRREAEEQGATPVGAFQEPYRLEGEKTIGYEIADELGWSAPDWIVWPTGGAVGLVGLAKAFLELEALSLTKGKRPGLIAVQVEGCSPLVDALQSGKERCDYKASVLESIAPGITVSNQAFDDLILPMIRQFPVHGATADESAIRRFMREVARTEGLLISPEGAAAVAAAAQLREGGLISATDTVVIVNTATGLRYPHLL